MEKIASNSSWNLPPTSAQTYAITKLCMHLRIKTELECSPSNRREARNLIYQLKAKLRGGSKRMETKPVCKLTGTDGNIFSIIGKVRDCLRANGQSQRGTEFAKKAFLCNDYDQLLALVHEYVTVE